MQSIKAKTPAPQREIFIGLIAQIGVDLELVQQELTNALNDVDYTASLIKLSDFVSTQKSSDSYIDNVSSKISECNEFRGKTVDQILSLAAIKQIYESRGTDSSVKRESANKPIAHIFRQLKRVEEIRQLQKVYGRNLLLVGCYASKETRVKRIVSKSLRQSRKEGRAAVEAKALKLIATDESEVSADHGQRVLDCFPFSDFVIDCNDRQSIEKSCKRMISIYFGKHFESPTRDEYGSYLARCASFRSSDLSRQVGAAILKEEGEIIALGCNEVPKAFGGTYWNGDENDERDFVRGFDSNQQIREELTKDFLDCLADGESWLIEDITKKDSEGRMREALQKKLTQSMVMDVIEFGRVVHAEMNALTDAARFRRSTRGAKLYCTTMPCHMCSKLIIASGIKQVVYIQPYSKSLSPELFSDSITFDGSESSTKVNFSILTGVTPNGYKRAFEKNGNRKGSDGYAKKWGKEDRRPTFVSTYPYYIFTEQEAVEENALHLNKM